MECQREQRPANSSSCAESFMAATCDEVKDATDCERVTGVSSCQRCQWQRYRRRRPLDDTSRVCRTKCVDYLGRTFLGATSREAKGTAGCERATGPTSRE